MNEFSVDGLAFCLIDQADFRSELLHELERTTLSPHASPSRLAQFGLGRAAARQALRTLEKEPGAQASILESASPQVPPSASPILMDAHGAPVWPPQTTGSISHTRSFEGGQRRGIFSAVAVVGSTTKYTTVGIDLEDSARRLSPEIMKKAASPAEESWVRAEMVTAAAPSLDRATSDRLLFLLSAKEALYKAVFPLCFQYFGFLDAELVLPQEGPPKQIRLTKTLAPTAVKGSLFSIGSRRLGRLTVVWIAVPKDLAV